MVALILCFKYSDIAESQRKASSVMSPQAQVAQKLVSVTQCDSGQDIAGFLTTGRWHCWYLSSTASNRTRLYLYLGHHQKISSAAIFSPAPVHQSYGSTSIFSWDHKITCEENTTSAGCVLGHKGAVSQSTGRSVASVLQSHHQTWGQETKGLSALQYFPLQSQALANHRQPTSTAHAFWLQDVSYF